MLSHTKYFHIKTRDKIIKVPIDLFNINPTAKKFYEKYNHEDYQTDEDAIIIDTCINILRGYQYPTRSKSISDSKIACLLGITNKVIINVNGKIFIFDKKFLTDNFEYFNNFFHNYKHLDPDYTDIQIDRSDIIFEYIIDHINGLKYDQYVILNYLPDIKLDLDYYGYKNKELPFDYVENLILDLDQYTKKCAIILDFTGFDIDANISISKKCIPLKDLNRYELSAYKAKKRILVETRTIEKKYNNSNSIFFGNYILACEDYLYHNLNNKNIISAHEVYYNDGVADIFTKSLIPNYKSLLKSFEFATKIIIEKSTKFYSIEHTYPDAIFGIMTKTPIESCTIIKDDIIVCKCKSTYKYDKYNICFFTGLNKLDKYALCAVYYGDRNIKIEIEFETETNDDEELKLIQYKN